MKKVFTLIVALICATGMWGERSFVDFKLDFRSSPCTVVLPDVEPSTVSFIDTVWHGSQHGLHGGIITVEVDGPVKFTIGNCHYGSSLTIMKGVNEYASVSNYDATTCDNSGVGNGYNHYVEWTYNENEAATLSFVIGNSYVPYFFAEKVEASSEYTITYAKPDGVEGTVPAAAVVLDGESATLPLNRSLYKEGYTLTGWSDGVNNHVPGESYTPTQDVTLTAVFTANQANVLELTSEVTVAWDFLPANGAPNIAIQPVAAQQTAFLVAQAAWSSYTIDVKLEIDASESGAKFDNTNNANWAQVNPGTKFRFVSKPHTILQAYTYVDPRESELDGMKYDTYSSNEVTFTATSTTGSSELVSIDLSQWYRWIKVTYPAIDPTGMEETIVNRKSSNRKLLKDGQLFIVRDGKTYTITGAELR